MSFGGNSKTNTTPFNEVDIMYKKGEKRESPLKE